MEKKEFVQPNIEVIEIEASDVITTSGEKGLRGIELPDDEFLG